MSLSPRGALVLSDILSVTTPVRLSEIASRHGVSERTVKSDVNRARTWLERHGFALTSAGAHGVWVKCTDAERTTLLDEIRPSAVELDQSARQQITCLQVLTSNHPVSITGLADDLGVARNTVLHDLADIEGELEPFEIQLERTRLGLAVVGDRSQVLLALDQVLRARLRNDDLALLTAFVSDPGSIEVAALSGGLRWVFERLPDPEAVSRCVAGVVAHVTRQFSTPSDIAIGGMVIRLALVVLTRGEPASARPEPADDLRRLIQASVVRFEQATGGGLDPDDLEFVFQEAVLAAAAHEVRQQQLSDERTVGITEGLIERVEDRLGVHLKQDVALTEGLIAHLSGRFAKLRNRIIEPNLLVKEVLVQYADLHRAVQAVSEDYLTTLGYELSEADLSFLTVHFAAAYERFVKRPRVRTLIVCATGRGVATLIGLLVQSQFPSIEIVRTTSMFEVQQSGVADVDLVISTFPITVGKPLAVIRSVPTKRDFDTIKARLDQVAETNPELSVGPVTPRDGRPREPVVTFVGLVTLGMALEREVIAAAGREIPGVAAEGFRLHCLLLAERITGGKQYAAPQATLAVPLEDPLRERVGEVFVKRRLEIQESELQAILAYFTYEEGP